VTRIDDRYVAAINHFLSLDVQLARPVASLAADSVALKDGFFVPVDRQLYGLDMVGVAKQTLGLDCAVKMEIESLVAG
jgi:hypothetical protein